MAAVVSRCRRRRLGVWTRNLCFVDRSWTLNVTACRNDSASSTSGSATSRASINNFICSSIWTCLASQKNDCCWCSRWATSSVVVAVGVAQWLGRRSLAGDFPALRLIHGWHVTTSWVICPLWVNQPGQLNLASLLYQQMSSTYMDYGGRDQ